MSDRVCVTLCAAVIVAFVVLAVASLGVLL
jgi:hypothetical protein